MSFLLSSGAIDVIPDIENLHAQYDATKLSLADGNAVSTWADETGNGYDLTAGTAPIFKTGIINGNPIVRFDGVDDFLGVTFSALSQPNHIFIVAKFNSNAGGGNQPILDGESSRHEVGENNNGWQLFAGTSLSGGTADTNNHIWSGLFDTSSSVLRVDGTQIASGDTGSDNLNGLVVGTNQPQGEFGEVDVGEILVYPQDKSGIVSDVESYLSDKWGIAI